MPDVGNVLGYSATAGEIDHDGKADSLSNEMFGKGIPPAPADVGNLVIFERGLLLAGPGGRQERRFRVARPTLGETRGAVLDGPPRSFAS